jgi:hypothetical protein
MREGRRSNSPSTTTLLLAELLIAFFETRWIPSTAPDELPLSCPLYLMPFLPFPSSMALELDYSTAQAGEIKHTRTKECGGAWWLFSSCNRALLTAILSRLSA